MDLSYERKNVWLEVDEGDREKIFTYGESYKDFLSVAKTERRANAEIIRQAEERGFKNFEDIGEGQIKPGDKFYVNNNHKACALFVMGEDLKEGMNIVASHIDSPRLDLKANPLYEDSNLSFFKTHYYGGVKKYQWPNLPLALHGIAYTKDGKEVDIMIGEDEDDPVFYINDLLIHLSKDQLKKTMAEGISAEQLNIVVGSIPKDDEGEKEPYKRAVLQLINEKYGLIEEDFQVAEIQAVPAGRARDVGFDRSLIAGHGHDDRVCAYGGLISIFKIEKPKVTAVSYFTDKEEVGSMGNTGADNYFFENLIADIFYKLGEEPIYNARKSLARSKILSADVTAAYDPNFPEVFEKLNSAYTGCGVSLSKYTGSGGKGGSNDANPEFLQEVREVFDRKGVIYQTSELGKTDQGGGGTIAYLLARYGAQVVDCGTPMLSMHAPIELLSKADAYMTCRAYRAFFEDRE